MRSVLFAILTGLVGAALLHIVIILALPQFTGRDAYSRVLGLDAADTFLALPAKPGPTGLSSEDPFVRVAVCSFSVTSGPVRLRAQGKVPFWSIAVYDTKSNEVFSMNDKTAVDGQLDLVIATPIQRVDLRKTPVESLSQSILVEMPQDDGYAVLRVLSPSDSFTDLAHAFLAAAQCDLWQQDG